MILNIFISNCNQRRCTSNYFYRTVEVGNNFKEHHQWGYNPFRVGTNLMTVTVLKKTEVTIREMGGAMGPIWHNYYKDSHAIMFMIDKSKHTQVAISCVQLLTMLSHPLTQNVPVLIILNKIDIPNGLTNAESESLFRFDELTKQAPQKITIVETSAKNGSNLDKVAKWIYDQNKNEDTSSA